MRVAKWLGVDVLTLEQAPLHWFQRGLIAMEAEAKAKPILEKRAELKAKFRRK